MFTTRILPSLSFSFVKMDDLWWCALVFFFFFLCTVSTHHRKTIKHTNRWSPQAEPEGVTAAVSFHSGLFVAHRRTNSSDYRRPLCGCLCAQITMKQDCDVRSVGRDVCLFKCFHRRRLSVADLMMQRVCGSMPPSISQSIKR